MAPHTLRRLAGGLALAAVAFATPAHAQTLFSQRALVTNPGAGFGGADVSALQAPLTTIGFNANSTSFRLADNFTVTGGDWTVTGFRFFAYQTTSTTTSTFTQAFWRLWSGRPGDGGSAIVAGDLTTNRITSSAFTGIYRTQSSTPAELLSASRPIMSIDAAANLVLTPGEYWLEWALGGTLGSGPFVPPITINNTLVTGDARQFSVATNTWADAESVGNRQGLPFEVLGTSTVVPEPSTYALMATGLVGLVGVVRRRRAAR